MENACCGRLYYDPRQNLGELQMPSTAEWKPLA